MAIASLQARRQVGDHHGPRGARVHRQPAAGGAVARGAAHGGRGRGDRRADRPVHHRRPRPAVARPRSDADLPPRRRPGRDGAHARPLRPLAASAVDAAGRRRAHPRAARRRGRRLRARGRRPDHRRPGRRAGPRRHRGAARPGPGMTAVDLARAGPGRVDRLQRPPLRALLRAGVRARDRRRDGRRRARPGLPERERRVALHRRGARPVPRRGARPAPTSRCARRSSARTGKLLWIWHEL